GGGSAFRGPPTAGPSPPAGARPGPQRQPRGQTVTPSSQLPRPLPPLRRDSPYRITPRPWLRSRRVYGLHGQRADDREGEHLGQRHGESGTEREQLAARGTAFDDRRDRMPGRVPLDARDREQRLHDEQADEREADP